MLRSNDIETAEQFMQLTKAKVLSLQGLGAKSWREIQEIQDMLTRESKRESFQDRIIGVLDKLNSFSLEKRGLIIVRDSYGNLRLARFVD